MTGLMDCTSIGSVFWIVVILLALILAYILYWLSGKKKEPQTVVETPVKEPVKRAEVVTIEEPITSVAASPEATPVVGSAPAEPVITEIKETNPGEPKKE